VAAFGGVDYVNLVEYNWRFLTPPPIYPILSLYLTIYLPVQNCGIPIKLGQVGGVVMDP
jgi:hypothetical protein